MSSGQLLLFVSLALIAVVGMSALNSLHNEVNTTDANVTAAANTAQSVEVPLFTALGYIALAIAALGVLGAFRNL